MSLAKKLLFGGGAVILIVIGYVAYVMTSTKSHSPAAIEAFELNGMSLEIKYCRPFKKERLIFGSVEDGALLPHGKYWRLGANEATKLTINKDIQFGDEVLEKGSYSVYAFPEADHWVIGVNSEADRWGATPPDFSKDIIRIKVPVITVSDSQEQFGISLKEEGGNPAMIMQWDQTQVRVPIKPVD